MIAGIAAAASPMKRRRTTNNLRRYLAALVLSVSVVAQAQQVKVMLFDHIIGPAVKTQSLQLLDDGSVVDERYDITIEHSGSSLQSRVVCRYSSDSVDDLVKQIAEMAEVLPSDIDAGRPLSIDGPSKLIEVTTPNGDLRSVWDDPSTKNLSSQAQQFVHVWEGIRTLLLGCQK
jgi:hypothetical protein